MAAMGDNAEDIISKGVAEVLADQERAGIDIPTDGEVPRENYIHYHCRHLEGNRFFESDGKDSAQRCVCGSIANDPGNPFERRTLFFPMTGAEPKNLPGVR